MLERTLGRCDTPDDTLSGSLVVSMTEPWLPEAAKACVVKVYQEYSE